LLCQKHIYNNLKIVVKCNYSSLQQIVVKIITRFHSNSILVELDMPRKSLHLDESDHLPLWSHLLLHLSGFCHYVHFFITFYTDIIVFSSLIPPLLDFTRIPLDLATPFNFFMYSHAYIYFRCSNLLGLFVYTSTTSFLTGYYLWKNHLPHSCICIWTEWNIPLKWPIHLHAYAL
jgi:hypothetical protein